MEILRGVVWDDHRKGGDMHAERMTACITTGGCIWLETRSMMTYIGHDGDLHRAYRSDACVE